MSTSNHRPMWYAQQQAALDDLLRGRRTELAIALDLLLHGFTIRISTLDPWGVRDYASDFDIEANGVLVEVKGRAIEFSSPADYPYPTIFLGSESQWLARLKLGTTPEAIVVVSEKTGARLVVPRSSASTWVIDPHGRDVITGAAVVSYAAPRECARDFVDLVDWLGNHKNGGDPCQPH